MIHTAPLAMRHEPARAVAITCDGVSKSFAALDRGNAWRIAFGQDQDVPRFQALKNVSMDVPKGQFVGVLGRNGAGKSTLLRTIGGVYVPDAGRISTFGSMSGLYELGLVGNPELTGRQYSDRLLRLNGFSADDRVAMVADIHEFSELGDRFDDPVRTYSAGMGARLYFASATAGRYEVYLLDEILSVGDEHFQSKCWRRLRERVSGGAAGILVTHDWAAILRLCETAHILEQGQLTYSGPAELAVRTYLYGPERADELVAGVARFVNEPSYDAIARQRDDFVVRADVEILQDAEVFTTLAVERLQPGFGWETSFMSRAPVLVGNAPGRYHIEYAVPALPLEPGRYEIRIGLMLVDATTQTRVGLDGYSWLNGTGLPLAVTGDQQDGIALPVRWTVQ